ncbi:MAG: hypothetical protein M1839_007840 [Geoglossum umbratile]|nr:MAG: hypothetical protein M1839_007840 [Geoglossum umbratile]
MSSTTINVKNISHLTSEKEVRDFFSFCGKISTLSVTPISADPESTKSATVTFEKDTAAKTALLLDNTQLGPNSVQVSGVAGLDELASDSADASRSDEIDQEDKPRSRIIAEYLAHGYVVGDQAVQKAIELDKKHGFSDRFTTALKVFDSKYQATNKARSMDNTCGVTKTAGAGWRGINHYFEKALGTPTGQRVRTFYTQSEKQALDIHNEARRLANLRKSEAAAGEPVSSDTKEKTTYIDSDNMKSFGGKPIRHPEHGCNNTVFPRNTRARTLAVAPEDLATSQASFTAAVVRSVGAAKGAIDALPVELEGRGAGFQDSKVGRGRPDWWESFTGLVGTRHYSLVIAASSLTRQLSIDDSWYDTSLHSQESLYDREAPVIWDKLAAKGEMTVGRTPALPTSVNEGNHNIDDEGWTFAEREQDEANPEGAKSGEAIIKDL